MVGTVLARKMQISRTKQPSPSKGLLNGPNPCASWLSSLVEVSTAFHLNFHVWDRWVFEVDCARLHPSHFHQETLPSKAGVRFGTGAVFNMDPARGCRQVFGVVFGVAQPESGHDVTCQWSFRQGKLQVRRRLFLQGLVSKWDTELQDPFTNTVEIWSWSHTCWLPLHPDPVSVGCHPMVYLLASLWFPSSNENHACGVCNHIQRISWITLKGLERWPVASPLLIFTNL